MVNLYFVHSFCPLDLRPATRLMPIGCWLLPTSISVKWRSLGGTVAMAESEGLHWMVWWSDIEKWIKIHWKTMIKDEFRDVFDVVWWNMVKLVAWSDQFGAFWSHQLSSGNHGTVRFPASRPGMVAQRHRTRLRRPCFIPTLPKRYLDWLDELCGFVWTW